MFIWIWDRSVLPPESVISCSRDGESQGDEGQGESQGGEGQGGEGQGGEGQDASIHGCQAAAQDGEGPIEIHMSFRAKKPRI